MKLLDLLSVIDESNSVFVWAHDIDNPGQDILVSVYDGKDSIDPEYNNEIVQSVSSPTDECIDIVIDCEVSSDAAIDIY